MPEKKTETKAPQGFSSILQHEFRPFEDNDQKIRMTENTEIKGLDFEIFDGGSGEWTRISLAADDLDIIVLFANAVRDKHR